MERTFCIAVLREIQINSVKGKYHSQYVDGVADVHGPPDDEGAQKVEKHQVAGAVALHVGELVTSRHALGEGQDVVAGAL